MNYGPKTTRSTRNTNRNSVLSNNPSLFFKTTSKNGFFGSNESSETIKLRKEVSDLQKNLSSAHRELQVLKNCHETETRELREAFESMKTELETLRAEKAEKIALQSYGIDEYSILAQEVIKLRTEVDRVTYLYNKEKKKNFNL